MNYFSLETIKFIKNEFEKKLNTFSIEHYKIDDFQDVLVVNDSFVLYLHIVSQKATSVENYGKYYFSLYISELTFNEIDFKYDHKNFIKNMTAELKVSPIIDYFSDSEESYIVYEKFKGFSYSKWSGWLSLPERINKELPELKLKERFESQEGLKYYFVIIEFIINNKIYRGVAYTMMKPHLFIVSLGRRYIKTGTLSNEIRVTTQEFHKEINKLKGISRKERFENYMKYFFFEKCFREKDDVWRYADILLKQANDGKFDKIERSTYIRPKYKWINEELVLKLTKKLYKDYTIIYQYKPFFLHSSFGGQMSYDIFIQELNVAIEYQGKQHFEPVDFFGGEDSFEKVKIRDEEKRKLSAEHGIKLVYINFDEVITSELIRIRVEGDKL